MRTGVVTRNEPISSVRLSPDALISSLTEIDDRLAGMFVSGDCYRFSCFLAKMYPEATQWISGARDHVVTEIGGTFYDATGRVSKKRIERDGYHPMDDGERRAAEKWRYRRYA